MTESLRHRPGDQRLPERKDGPSVHDLVIADLQTWPAPKDARRALRDLLGQRKQLGLERYGSVLQAGNGRDWRRDLAEELSDAACYAMQGMEETVHGPGWEEAVQAYEHAVRALLWLAREGLWWS